MHPQFDLGELLFYNDWGVESKGLSWADCDDSAWYNLYVAVGWETLEDGLGDSLGIVAADCVE